MDVLSDVLSWVQLKSSVYCRSELGSRWSLHFKPMPCAVFHVLHRGQGFIRLDDTNENIPLNTGDVLMIPQGSGHTITNDLGRSSRRNIPLDRYGECALLRWSENPTSILLCGTFDLEHTHPLLDLLPPILLVRGVNQKASAGLQPLLELMALEAQSEGVGRQTVLRRMADVLFVQMVRQWVQSQGGASGGWLGALQDAELAQALSLMHAQPAENWTVGALASAVGMGRSSFSARFAQRVGQPPLRYLTRWRLHTAARLLKQPQVGIREVAERVGYVSEVAFCKAFKRELGIAPGAYRRASQQPELAKP